MEQRKIKISIYSLVKQLAQTVKFHKSLRLIENRIPFHQIKHLSAHSIVVSLRRGPQENEMHSQKENLLLGT